MGHRPHDEKRALAAKLGAHATFPSGERLPDRVDAVFETVGDGHLGALDARAQAGRHDRGLGLDERPEPGADLQRLFFLQLRVVGRPWAPATSSPTCSPSSPTPESLPEIGLELPLERAEEGFRAMAAGETGGKIVFTH